MNTEKTIFCQLLSFLSKYEFDKCVAQYNGNDWHIFADFCHDLIGWAEKLYHDDRSFTLELKNAVYAVDSTTIDLCLSLFPWAKFRKQFEKIPPNQAFQKTNYTFCDSNIEKRLILFVL